MRVAVLSTTRRPGKRWLLLAIAIKLAYLFMCLGISYGSGMMDAVRRPWLIEGGDSSSYLGSVDNLVDHGIYGYDLNRRDSRAARMPGYAIVYFPARLLFTRNVARDLCAVLQAVLDGVAVYYLAVGGWLLTRSPIVLGLTYVGALVSTYVSWWDSRGLTETWGAAAAVLAVYSLIAFGDDRRWWRIPLGGALSAWCVFLKPVSVILVCVFGLALFIDLTRRTGWSYGRSGAYVALFLVPFGMMEGAWIARNYREFGRFVPLTIRYYYPHYSDSLIALNDWVKGWGGDVVAWNPKAEIRWFDENAWQGHGRITYGPPRAAELPAYVYTSCYDRQKLLELRQGYLRAHDIEVALAERELWDARSARTLRMYRECFRREKPLRYYLWAPLKLTGDYLLHSGTYNLFPLRWDQLGPVASGFKALQSIVYVAVIALGLPWALIVLLRGIREGDGRWIAVGFVPLLFGLFFPVCLRMVEYRYFVPGFSMTLLCAVIGAREIHRWLSGPRVASPV